MGYRISLYVCPKEYVESIKDITEEEYETNPDIIDGLKNELIKYDTLANVLDTGNEIKDNLCSKLFTNRLEIEYDMSFYTISKEQLLNIIEYIRKHNIFEYLWFHTVDYDQKKFYEDLSESKTYKYSNSLYKCSKFEDAVRESCIDARFDARLWNNYYVDDNGIKRYTNIDTTENKWIISNGMSYKYFIFNLIHILKIFDWDNYCLIAIGG